MMRTATEVAYLYKIAEDLNYAEDLEDAYYARERLGRSGAPQAHPQIVQGIKDYLLAAPTHPRQQKSGVLPLTVAGAGLGGLFSLPFSVFTPKAIPAGMAVGGTLGLAAGLQHRRWRTSPAADSHYQQALATQQRRSEDPDRLHRIATEVADEWDREGR